MNRHAHDIAVAAIACARIRSSFLEAHVIEKIDTHAGVIVILRRRVPPTGGSSILRNDQLLDAIAEKVAGDEGVVDSTASAAAPAPSWRCWREIVREGEMRPNRCRLGHQVARPFEKPSVYAAAKAEPSRRSPVHRRRNVGVGLLTKARAAMIASADQRRQKIRRGTARQLRNAKAGRRAAPSHNRGIRDGSCSRCS